MLDLNTCMEELQSFYSSNKVLCNALVAATVAGIAVLGRWLKRPKRREPKKDYPRDTVILHDVGRGPYAPSVVPFAVKLETYLRIAKIPYQCEHGLQKSGKSKWPWISYNGEEMADSSFIMQFLNKEFSVDLNARLSEEQRAVAVAFQRLVEDDLYWTLVVTRYVNEPNMDFIQKHLNFPGAQVFFKTVMKPDLTKKCWAQGIGRHTQEEVRQIARKDLTALTNYLGKKKFLMGDQPCEEDCTVFGQLSQIYWHLPSTVSDMFKKEFPQLVAYCDRMKDTFWPDWDECNTQGGTVKATR